MRLYAEVIQDDTQQSRSAERDLLLRSVELIECAQASGKPMNRAWIDAIAFSQKLWSTLLTDLASRENALPAETRASLISIGLFVLRALDDVRGGRSDDLTAVADVTNTIADALK